MIFRFQEDITPSRLQIIQTRLFCRCLPRNFKIAGIFTPRYPHSTRQFFNPGIWLQLFQPGFWNVILSWCRRTPSKKWLLWKFWYFSGKKTHGELCKRENISKLSSWNVGLINLDYSSLSLGVPRWKTVLCRNQINFHIKGWITVSYWETTSLFYFVKNFSEK